ncbi:MAG: YggS family pyridoxal phosphate-dependent enzyme [Clostridioides sp.]|jgi:pyridoxal phosphate enzyme (YggS family)|nr:YggS family pyridoxal phosphate-dependent enzyme [Clostridioides sp.]
MSEVKRNLQDVESQIENVCVNSGRNKDEVKLLAVTKTVDNDKMLEAFEYGIRDFGENKPQELTRKYEEFGELAEKINWHLIGTLQTNKVKYIIDKVYLIHSLDRISLCEEIQHQAKKVDKTIDCLVQVNISREETKHGVFVEDIESFIRKISEEYDSIRVKGLMSMAPFTDDEEGIRKVFKGVKDIATKIDNLNLKNVSMDILSIGMSNDFEIAIEEGSTLVRVGTAIFGKRNNY